MPLSTFPSPKKDAKYSFKNKFGIPDALFSALVRETQIQISQSISADFASGTYTPTSTDTNVASKTWQLSHYSRVGSEVTLSVQVLVAATAPGTVAMDFDIPIASVFASIDDAKGVAIDTDNSDTNFIVRANPGVSTIKLSFTAANTSSHVVTATLMYTIV